MEREGTTKTFVVSTKIFVDAQNRRMQSKRRCSVSRSRRLHSRDGERSFIMGPQLCISRPAKKVGLSD